MMAGIESLISFDNFVHKICFANDHEIGKLLSHYRRLNSHQLTMKVKENETVWSIMDVRISININELRIS